MDFPVKESPLDYHVGLDSLSKERLYKCIDQKVIKEVEISIAVTVDEKGALMRDHRFKPEIKLISRDGWAVLLEFVTDLHS